MKSYLAAAFVSLFTFSGADAGIIINSPATYTQNFDSLAITGTSTVTPVGWEFLETGTAANSLYSAGTGSDNTGDTYSFGSSGNADRALGGIRSGSLTPTIGVSFTNIAASSIQSLEIAYEGEQWRLGAIGRTDRLDFQYSVNATNLNNGTWLDFNALDFISPFTSATGALDGNLSTNRTSLANSISGLNIGTGQTVWLRWNDFDSSGSDDGLAIDNFSLTAQFAAVPEPSSIAFIFASGLCTAIYQRRCQRQSRT
ncbi:MAG: hypothetical protein U0936_07340 [Planctomycetaceae bacterium]